ncbi:MAG TPA: SAM-dependent methyltransferase, partial [Gammaproteobacteria bacterium]
MANINIIAPPRYSIALTSAVALAYEILLVRLFSISQWHHFAYMIISLALLGYGMSGAFLALFRQALLDRFKSAFVLNLLLFASLLLSSYTLAQHTAFNSEEILWDPSQWLRLTVSYLLLSLPFFFIANAIGLALMHFHQQVARVYGADLLGAGMGSLGIVALLFLLFPESTLKLLAALGFASAWLATAELKVSSRALRWLPSVFMVFTLLLPTTWFTATLSPYKDLNQILQIGGTRVIARESSPMGLITVVESTQVPLRHAPGMSL